MLERAPKFNFGEFIKLFSSNNDAISTSHAPRTSQEKEAPVEGDGDVYSSETLQDHLNKVLHMSNDEAIREALLSFSNSIKYKSSEAIRRKAYETLYNRCLDTLVRRGDVPPHKEATQADVYLSLTSASPRTISKRRSEDPDHVVHTSTKKARLTSLCMKSTDADMSFEDAHWVLSAETQAQVAARGPMKILSTYGPRAEDAINTVIVDDSLYLWTCDRQDIIRSETISIVADFPRFLMFLLTVHHLDFEDWGVPWANTECLGIDKYTGPDVKEVLCLPVEKHTVKDQYVPESPQRNFDNITMEGPLFIGEEGYLPHCIASQGRSVFKAVHDEKAHAVKTPSTEAQRLHEVNPARIGRAFLDESKSALTKGRRTLRLVVSEELVPLTSRTGKSFIDAWLDAVTCHASLWKHGVEHSDPSLWNVMYHPGRKCGVLTDFDLSVIAWLTRVPGTDRTGTIPFMALELLHDAYWAGSITRHYHHELESFIWILPFVFVGYNDGKFDPKTPFIKDWITSDHVACAKEKSYFISHQLLVAQELVEDTFKDYGTLISTACLMVRNVNNARQDQAMALALERRAHFKDGAIFTPALYIEQSEAMWDRFVTVLSHSSIDTTALKKHKPVFDPARNRALFQEMEVLHKSLPHVRSPHVL